MVDKDRYKEHGVSSSKKDVHTAVEKIGLKSNVSDSFVILVDDLAGDPRYLIAQHPDGSGTVSGTIYTFAMEKNEPAYMQRIAPFAVIMNTDDVGCAAPYEKGILTNIINRNTFRIDEKLLSNTIIGFDEYLKWLNGACGAYFESNFSLDSGETADLPDIVETLTVDAVLTTRVERDKVLSGKNIQPGDVIISVAGGGKRAKYENSDVNDWGSNGHTIIKRSILSPIYTEKYPETLFAEFTDRFLEKDLPEGLKLDGIAEARGFLEKNYGDSKFIERMIKKGAGYYGQYEFDDIIPGTGKTAADALTLPPRTYLPITDYLHRVFGDNGLVFMVQNTGGGQTKPINFGENLLYEINDFFKVPALFEEIQAASGQPWRYMYSSCSCGARLTVIARPDSGDAIASFIRKKFGVDAKVTGEVRRNDATNPKNKKGNTLVIDSEYGKFTYPEEGK